MMNIRYISIKSQYPWLVSHQDGPSKGMLVPVQCGIRFAKNSMRDRVVETGSGIVKDRHTSERESFISLETLSVGPCI